MNAFGFRPAENTQTKTRFPTPFIPHNAQFIYFIYLKNACRLYIFNEWFRRADKRYRDHSKMPARWENDESMFSSTVLFMRCVWKSCFFLGFSSENLQNVMLLFLEMFRSVCSLFVIYMGGFCRFRIFFLFFVSSLRLSNNKFR